MIVPHDDHGPEMAEANPKIGFGSPPQATRFQKGQSGNPSGRPKDPTARTLLKSFLAEEIDYSENGRRARASKKAVFLSKVVADGLTGGVRERQQLLDLMAKYTPEEFQEEPTAVLSKDRQSILERFIQRLGDGAGRGSSTPSTDTQDEEAQS